MGGLDLSKLYERMIDEIRISDSRELYIRLLAMASTVFRPLTFSELLAMEQLEANGTLMDENILANVIKECGSFLTSKEKTIIFVHQSAREYLLKESSMLLYPSGLAHYHYTIFKSSIDILESLRKDIYNLKHPGTSLNVAIRNRPNPDPLHSLTYALVFWHDHIREAYDLSTRESTEIISHSDAPALIEDAIRFLLLFSPVIEDYPLQTYASGLLFSPQKSIIRRLFKQYTPEFIATCPRVEENWSPILSVFETSSGTKIRTMSFSSTSNMLAMTMSDSQLLIRNIGDGSVLRRSKYENATLLTPSPDLQCLASILTRYSVDTQELIQDTLEVRDIDSNNILWTRTLDGREALVMGFSPDGKWLAVCYREELHVFTRKGELLQSWGLELGPHILCQDQIPWYLTFSSDCAMLLLRYYAEEYSMLVFDIQTSMQYKTPEVYNTPSNEEIWFESVKDAKFIPGTHLVMMCVDELGIYTWDFLKGECEEFFECGNSFSCFALSHADPWVFTQAGEFLSLWDRHEKSPLQDFKLPRKSNFKEIQVSYDGKHVAVCSSTTVWLVEVDAILDDKTRSGKQKDMIPYISSNGSSIAYRDFKNAIEIHNQMTGDLKNTVDIKGKVRGSVHSMAFSPDGQLFAFSDDSFLYVWDLNQGSLRHSLEIPARAKIIAISGESADGQWVAVCTAFEVLTWDVNKGQLQRSIQSPGSLDRHPYGACFAGTRLGVSWYYSPFQSIGSTPHEIFVLYDIKTGQHLLKLNLPCSWVLLGAPGGRISVSPNGKWVVSYVFECRRLLLSDVEKGIQYAVIDVDATWFSFTDDITLFTEKGVIHLDHILDGVTDISERDRSQTVKVDNEVGLELPVVIPIFGKYRCSAHCEWITINDSPLLWLPKQYRFGTQEYLGEMAIGYHYVTMDSFSGLYYIRFAEDAGENF
ncbi:heterokaryon incompatibility protein het-E-1 [Fusarium sp. NRRL 52700]|nr:heterokaryon incompatibility protein het-E-1 [Fusarium sp. NRRL 52700]